MSAERPLLEESLGADEAACCRVKSMESSVELEPWPGRRGAPFCPS